MALTQGYAVLDASGNLVTLTATATDAIGIASGFARQVLVEDEPDLGGALGDTDLGDLGDVGAKSAAKAFAHTGLPRLDLDDVMRMSIKDAHHALFPYFPTQRWRKNKQTGRKRLVTLKKFRTPAGLYSALLGQNYKTGKTGDEEIQGRVRALGYGGSEVQGLSLLPFNLAKGLASGDPQGVRLDRLLAHQAEYPSQFRTLCSGSNSACRQSCLVYSGQNEADPYNVVSKAARTQALLAQPEAFVRMLVESIRLHTNRIAKAGWLPFIRLNVFSDVPWELFVPGLFDRFAMVQFYDYTKVPGRGSLDNYDLTFSFSGTNARVATAELERGRRLAVVFLVKGTLKTRREEPLPASWCGFDVVDGDESDLRPLDPRGVVVGLRWKMPMNKTIAKDTSTSFVVKVWEECGALVAATSARQEPITDADDADDADDDDE